VARTANRFGPEDEKNIGADHRTIQNLYLSCVRSTLSEQRSPGKEARLGRDRSGSLGLKWLSPEGYTGSLNHVVA